MGGGTTIKEAILRWEEKSGKSAAEATDVGLQFQWLPIEKMDNSLSMIQNVEKLSLSSNNIDKIAGLAALKNLKILSLGRNNIKSLAGLEPVADTLEELWISYNLIDKLKGVGVLKKLRVLYMSNNLVKEWNEVMKLQECTALEELLFVGNPIYDKTISDGTWQSETLKRIPQLKKLDGENIVRPEEEEEE